MSGPPAGAPSGFAPLPYTQAAGDTGVYPLLEDDYSNVVITTLVLGFSIYQAFVVISLLFEKRSSWRRPIYIFTVLSELGTLLYMVLTISMGFDSRMDPLPMCDKSLGINIAQTLAMFPGKIFYFAAACARCHQTEKSVVLRAIVYVTALLCFIFSILVNARLIPFFIARNKIYHDPSQIMGALMLAPEMLATITIELLMTTLFTMVVNGVYLHTIFSALSVSFGEAVLTVLKLGDAQWMLSAIFFALLNPIIRFAYSPKINMVTIVVHLQLICFLRISFSSTKTIVNMHSIAHKNTTHAALKSGGTTGAGSIQKSAGYNSAMNQEATVNNV